MNAMKLLENILDDLEKVKELDSELGSDSFGDNTKHNAGAIVYSKEGKSFKISVAEI